MPSTFLKSARHTVIGVAMIFFAGCASNGTAPDSLPRLSVVVEPCAELETSVRLLELDGDLHVHGIVRTKDKSRSVSGHFDMIVRTADGIEWARSQVHVRPQIRGGVHSASTRSTFDATFTGIPPDGSTVSVTHHNEPHSAH